MKPQRCRRIEIEIDVMHKMKAPQKGNLMSEDMPDVKRVIQEHDSKRCFQPHGQPQKFEQSHIMPLNKRGQAYGDGTLRQLKRGGADAGYSQIARGVREFGFHLATQRSAPLQPYKHAESAKDQQRDRKSTRLN